MSQDKNIAKCTLFLCACSYNGVSQDKKNMAHGVWVCSNKGYLECLLDFNFGTSPKVIPVFFCEQYRLTRERMKNSVVIKRYLIYT